MLRDHDAYTLARHFCFLFLSAFSHTASGDLALARSDCTVAPSAAPTVDPSAAPTVVPSAHPTFAPTGQPSVAPTLDPTAAPSLQPTQNPTVGPTFPFACSQAEKDALLCDFTNGGICFCEDAVCSEKKCGCANGLGCNNATCQTCTAAPTMAPTAVTGAPSVRPTSAPTVSPSGAPSTAPTYNLDFLEGKDNANEQLTNQEVAAVAGGIGALTLILIIIGAIIAALCVVAILATTTGIFIKHRVMTKLDSHVFEGELIEMKAVPQGLEIVNPNFDGFHSETPESGTKGYANGI